MLSWRAQPKKDTRSGISFWSVCWFCFCFNLFRSATTRMRPLWMTAKNRLRPCAERTHLEAKPFSGNTTQTKTSISLWLCRLLVCTTAAATVQLAESIAMMPMWRNDLFDAVRIVLESRKSANVSFYAPQLCVPMVLEYIWMADGAHYESAKRKMVGRNTTITLNCMRWHRSGMGRLYMEASRIEICGFDCSPGETVWIDRRHKTIWIMHETQHPTTEIRLKIKIFRFRWLGDVGHKCAAPNIQINGTKFDKYESLKLALRERWGNKQK